MNRTTITHYIVGHYIAIIIVIIVFALISEHFYSRVIGTDCTLIRFGN